MATKLHEVDLGATSQAPVGTSEASLSTELGQPVVPFYLAVSFSQSVRLSGWLSLTSLYTSIHRHQMLLGCEFPQLSLTPAPSRSASPCPPRPCSYSYSSLNKHLSGE